MVNRPYMIDIAHGDTVQGSNDEGFALVKAQGIAFLDHKITQGTEMVDRMCRFRRRMWMTDVAVPALDVDGAALTLFPKFGFYHFNDHGSAADQAKHFIASTKNAGYETGDDLCLDWERIGASGYARSAEWADEFCDAVEQWCGFALKVYGGDVPREQLVQTTYAVLDRFKLRRLWFCEYGAFNPHLVPEPWGMEPNYWQDDGDQWGPGPHKIPGLGGYCDNSTVVGSMTVAKVYDGWAGGARVV